MIDDEALKSVEKLHKMKVEGIISPEEFERSKEDLLFGAKRRSSGPSPSVGVSLSAPLDNEYLAWALLPLKKYADFTGRARRQEYWLFILLESLVLFATFLIAMPFGEAAVGAMVGLTLLAFLVPNVAVIVRRFHDQNRSGWFALMGLIPYAGWLILPLFMLIPGTFGENRFGSDPTENSPTTKEG